MSGNRLAKVAVKSHSSHSLCHHRVAFSLVCVSASEAVLSQTGARRVCGVDLV